MFRLLAVIRRTIAYYQMRRIEIELSSAIEVVPYIRDDIALDAMRITIKRLSLDLCSARARYQSFLPPGERIVWRIA